jgi:uncharacterized phage protein (TIGR02220 family)
MKAKAKDDDKTGWISLHRKIQQHWIYPQNNYTKFEAWIDLLLNANHSEKEEKVNLQNELYKCGRGQSLRSLETLSIKWGWDKSRVRRFLKLLQSDSMIVLEPLRKTTRITICNYDTYQHKRNTDETQVKRNGNADETQMNPNNNDNNDFNNGNNDLKDIFSTSDVISYLNEKTGKDFKPTNKESIKLITARQNEGYGLDDFKKVIDVKTAKWLGDPENDKYLRPDTLFTAKHFESYLNERFMTPPSKQGLSDMNHDLNPNDI